MADDKIDASIPDPLAIERAAALIAQADALGIAAGAGIGVDSGLPDFRGNAGFWRAYPALATDGVGFMDIASPSAFRAAPRRAWDFYGHRLALYRKTAPHAGFALLRRWGETMPHGSFVFTRNVDDQFQKAGFDPLRINECHGSIHYLQCMAPCSRSIWEAGPFDPAVDPAHCELLGPIPSCALWRDGASQHPDVRRLALGRRATRTPGSASAPLARTGAASGGCRNRGGPEHRDRASLRPSHRTPAQRCAHPDKPARSAGRYATGRRDRRRCAAGANCD